MDDPATLVPRDKHDLVTAHRAVAAGWPSVEPVLDQLVDWCLDGNWPVAKVLAPFIARLGPRAAEPVRRVLAGGDEPAKYFLLTDLVAEMPHEGLACLTGELRRLAESPTPGETREDLPDLASVQLARLDRRG
jgi:hypothetical protein